jgi:hypothetical protein
LQQQLGQTYLQQTGLLVAVATGLPQLWLWFCDFINILKPHTTSQNQFQPTLA